MNAAETRPPQSSAHASINASETIAPGGGNAGVSLRLMPGESIGDGYVIGSVLPHQGKQSETYLAKKWGKPYVIKLYHDGCRPSPRIQEYLLGVRHPNIVPLVEHGEYRNTCFEVYPQYVEGTLEEAKRRTPAHIQSIIIPSINEGLHELHGRGIVHCDIKPSNLFYANNEQSVVIGDCGIGGHVNANGRLIGAVRGTPEYAPRVRMIGGSAVMSAAYDYTSFGLVLCRMILGQSLFSGMSEEDISCAWEAGITLSGKIEGRFRTLIQGLLTEDEEKRWGYEQVKRWCEGEFIRPNGRTIYVPLAEERPIKPFIFGRFEGEALVVSSLHQLAKAIKTHWEQTKNNLKRRDLWDFVQQFDAALAEKVAALARSHDEDAAVFKLLLMAEKASPEIYYCGKKYEDLAHYVDSLSSGKDQIAIRFLTSGLLVHYLREMEYEPEKVDKLEQFIKKNAHADMAAICTICYTFQEGTSFEAFGVSVHDLDGLVGALAGHTVSEIDKLIASDLFRAWFYKLGYERELSYMNEMQVR